MVEIKNTKVYGLNESIIRSGYPMRDGDPESLDSLKQLNEKDLKRGFKLGQVDSGTGHDNFLKGIVVQFDVKYPEYWTPQFQRYSFADIISSQSKMHRLTKMKIEDSCNKYVDSVVIQNLDFWINMYNEWSLDRVFIPLSKREAYFFVENNSDINISGSYLTKYEVFMKIISNTPLGFEKWMGITTNYLQLKTIYSQRKSHKLKEDWGYFCDWIEKLPLFKTLVLSDKNA